MPGKYEITCGLLSNPRGTLIVTAVRGVGGGGGAPAADLVHRAAGGVPALPGARRRRPRRGDPRSFTDAIKAGDLDQARQLYLPARLAYAQIEPTAGRFADLATAIDASGRLFRAAGAGSRLQGLPPARIRLCSAPATLPTLAPVADALLADVTALQGRIAKLQPAPEQPLAANAAALGRHGAGAGPHGDEIATPMPTSPF